MICRLTVYCIIKLGEKEGRKYCTDTGKTKTNTAGVGGGALLCNIFMQFWYLVLSRGFII